MPKIPQSTIDRIRDQSDIVDIISEEVSLKRKGVNYFGRCLFHESDIKMNIHLYQNFLGLYQ